MKIKALHNSVLFTEDEVSLSTESGIILAIQTNDFTMGSTERINKEENQSGTVISVGDKVTGVKTGDKIMPIWREVAAINVGEKQYGIIEEEHILGVLE